MAHPLSLFFALPLAALFATVARAQILPPPPVPAGNPVTVDKALLGKALFWDEQLSSSHSVACGTCHIFTNGGSDPRSVTALHPGADGVFGTADDGHGSPGVVRHDALGRFVDDPLFGIRTQVTKRKAPSVINAAYAQSLFWDGRASDEFRDPVTGAIVLATGGALESQIAGPPVSDAEMSHIGRSWTDIANDIAGRTPLALAVQIPPNLLTFVQGQTYASLFQQVFGSPGVTPTRIIFAIATYERTLISDQSPFDLHLANGTPLPPQQAAGLVKFRGLCAACHTDVDPPVLTTGPVLDDFRNIGVRPLAEDFGRFDVTGDPLDQGRFRVPGMRNVALRAPYFHNGNTPTLTDVVAFYAFGSGFAANRDPLVNNIPGQMSVQDVLDVTAFFDALTDPRVANGLPPFDRPRLWSEGPDVPSTFGAGTAGTGGFAPASVVAVPAHLGNARHTVGCDNLLGGSFNLIAWDVAANATPFVFLGLNVYLAGTPNLALSGLQATQGVGPGGGYDSFTLPIPAAPQLAGVTLFGQWLSLDPQAVAGLTISDAFQLTLF
ncbi:MAG: cytochrome c peroxidase [Planctomycetota bacterium]